MITAHVQDINEKNAQQPGARQADADGARERLLSAMPVRERRLQLAGVSTAVLEGGDGRPVVLLHEQGEFAARWLRVIPDLVTTHRVVAPDLPGHGASWLGDGALGADRVSAWLDELIERTCASPPTLVGHMLGGAIAARYAIVHGDRLDRLVLVDSFGVGRFRPGLRFALALIRYLMQPNERTQERLFRQCYFDLDAVRDQMGEHWETYRAYVLDHVRTPSVKAALRILMRKTGVPAIPSADLARIAVPTTLVWGRHDPVMPLRIAEAASERYGWPLHVIERAADDPPMEQPQAFVQALRTALRGS
jgi:pimeloyl-ACP methyl ester carboxylesterase